MNTYFRCLESRIDKNNTLYGKFSLNSIVSGQGNTFANSLRRSLFSDLSGLAITHFCITSKPGLGYEFATLPGLAESVLDFSLNLKKVVITGRIIDHEMQKTIGGTTLGSKLKNVESVANAEVGNSLNPVFLSFAYNVAKNIPGLSQTKPHLRKLLLRGKHPAVTKAKQTTACFTDVGPTKQPLVSYELFTSCFATMLHYPSFYDIPSIERSGPCLFSLELNANFEKTKKIAKRRKKYTTSSLLDSQEVNSKEHYPIPKIHKIPWFSRAHKVFSSKENKLSKEKFTLVSLSSQRIRPGAATVGELTVSCSFTSTENKAKTALQPEISYLKPEIAENLAWHVKRFSGRDTALPLLGKKAIKVKLRQRHFSVFAQSYFARKLSLVDLLRLLYDHKKYRVGSFASTNKTHPSILARPNIEANQKISTGLPIAPIGFLKAKGPAILRAKDLILPSGIRCVHPNQYLGTLAADGVLSIKFLVAAGKGFIVQDEIFYNSLSRAKLLLNGTENHSPNNFGLVMEQLRGKKYSGESKVSLTCSSKPTWFGPKVSGAARQTDAWDQSKKSKKSREISLLRPSNTSNSSTTRSGGNKGAKLAIGTKRLVPKKLGASLFSNKRAAYSLFRSNTKVSSSAIFWISQQRNSKRTNTKSNLNLLKSSLCSIFLNFERPKRPSSAHILVGKATMTQNRFDCFGKAVACLSDLNLIVFSAFRKNYTNIKPPKNLSFSKGIALLVLFCWTKENQGLLLGKLLVPTAVLSKQLELNGLDQVKFVNFLSVNKENEVKELGDKKTSSYFVPTHPVVLIAPVMSSPSLEHSKSSKSNFSLNDKLAKGKLKIYGTIVYKSQNNKFSPFLFTIIPYKSVGDVNKSLRLTKLDRLVKMANDRHQRFFLSTPDSTGTKPFILGSDAVDIKDSRLCNKRISKNEKKENNIVNSTFTKNTKNKSLTLHNNCSLSYGSTDNKYSFKSVKLSKKQLLWDAEQNFYPILPLDVTFTPVSRVNFQINVDRNSEQAFETIIFEIWTNGSITPKRAIQESCLALAQDFYNFFCHVNEFSSLQFWFSRESVESKVTGSTPTVVVTKHLKVPKIPWDYFIERKQLLLYMKLKSIFYPSFSKMSKPCSMLTTRLSYLLLGKHPRTKQATTFLNRQKLPCSISRPYVNKNTHSQVKKITKIKLTKSKDLKLRQKVHYLHAFWRLNISDLNLSLETQLLLKKLDINSVYDLHFFILKKSWSLFLNSQQQKEIIKIYLNFGLNSPF